MPKAPDELSIGDVIFIEVAKEFKKLTDAKTFDEIWQNPSAIPASGTLTNQDVTNLDSGTDHIYYTGGAELLRNIEVTSLFFRDRNLLGTIGTGKLTQDRYPEGIPYPIDKWMYNKKPVISVEEKLGIALTANTDLVRFVGVDFTVEKTEDPGEGRYTTIHG